MGVALVKASRVNYTRVTHAFSAPGKALTAYAKCLPLLDQHKEFAVTATAERTTERTYRRGLNPLHSLLLGGTFPLFLGAALSDYAYSQTYLIQWSTFASWLIAGGLVFNGLALLCALIGVFRASDRRRLALVYFFLLLITWILGFFNALVHARDAWGMMPTGFVLSIVVSVLACVATWIGFSRLGAGGHS